MKYPKQLIALFFSLSLVACEQEKMQEDKLTSTEIIAVKTYQLQQAETNVVIESTGLLSTENEARYAFKIGGVIDRIYVDEGESFNRGKLLATLKIDEIESGYDQAKLGLEKAKRDLRRLTNLYQDSVVTLEQLQDAKTAYEISEKKFEAVAFNRQYAFIYAGNDGFVTKKIANEGEIVAGGSPILVINENSNNAWLLKVGLSDKDWAMIETGNNAKVSFDAFPRKEFNGIVSRKSMAADMGSGSFQVEIQVDFEGLHPAIGMFGKASIVTNSKYKYKSIPYEALIEADGNKAFVFVPLPDGKVKRQAVEIANFDNNDVKIKSGLENIKEVVLTNSAFLNENSIITIIQ